MIKQAGFDIVFKEVPDEISLAYSLSLCPNRCRGCHSSELRGDIGTELTTAAIQLDFERYKRYITCILFLGGDNDIDGLIELIRYAKGLGVKTAAYSGLRENLKLMDCAELDYVKLGPYNPRWGGLDSPTTNQKMFSRADGEWMDITKTFQPTGVL